MGLRRTELLTSVAYIGYAGWNETLKDDGFGIRSTRNSSYRTNDGDVGGGNHVEQMADGRWHMAYGRK